MKLLYGTGNPAKLESMRRRLADLDLEILGLGDMDRKAPKVPEDGNSPLENARQKALAYYDFFGIPVFSCDSGLYFEDCPRSFSPASMCGRCRADALRIRKCWTITALWRKNTVT